MAGRGCLTDNPTTIVFDNKHEVGRSARRIITTRESVVVRCMVSILFEFFASTNAHDTVLTRDRILVSYRQETTELHRASITCHRTLCRRRREHACLLPLNVICGRLHEWKKHRPNCRPAAPTAPSPWTGICRCASRRNVTQRKSSPWMLW